MTPTIKILTNTEVNKVIKTKEHNEMKTCAIVHSVESYLGNISKSFTIFATFNQMVKTKRPKHHLTLDLNLEHSGIFTKLQSDLCAN